MRALLVLLAWPWLANAADAPPQRLVTLSPHATELVFQVGAGERIVGTVDYSDYPAQATSIPRLGGFQGISAEALLALKPDLVITWPSGNPAPLLELLDRQGIPTLPSDPRSLQDIIHDLREIGERTGQRKAGLEAAQALERTVEALRERHADATPVKVFYEVWDSPLYTLGGDNVFNDLLAVCGGRNIFADVKHPSPVVSMESVLQRDPAVVLSGSRDGGETGQAWRARWQQWPSLHAVKQGRLYQVNPDIFTRPTGRVSEAASSLCTLLDSARSPQH